MLRSWREREFDGFGSSLLAPGRRRLAVTELILGVKSSGRLTARETRRALRDSCPEQPGVYGMLDADGELIYVGKSKSLRHRLTSYFQQQSDDAKARRIAARAERLIWEPAPHEFAALVRELELIRRWRPRFNVQGQPGRLRRTYLCLGRGPAAYAYLAPKAGSRAQYLFGPVSAGRRTRRAVTRLNDVFQLRDCPERVPMLFAEQLALWDQPLAAQCLRHELGMCLAPCAARCSSADYGSALQRARALLDGSDPTVITTLTETMQAAAAARQFERAAALRDALADLTHLRAQIERIDHVHRNYTFVYPLPGYGRSESWYLMRHGEIVGVAPAPTTATRAARCRQRLEDAYQRDELRPGLWSREEFSLVLLVSLWFRQHPAELARVIPVEAALAACSPTLQSKG